MKIENIEKLLDWENNGMNMAVDGQFLYIQSSLDMYKFDLASLDLAAQTPIFEKDGKARGFSIFGDLIFLHDFLDLYILSKDTLEIRDKLRLGENVSSDVNGVMWFEAPKAYVKIRNGWIYVLDINTKETHKIQVNESSFWSHCVTKDRLYAGTVKGELLEIDKGSLAVLRKIQLCKKNIYSVVHEDGLLYTISQDQSIKAVDAASFETVRENAKAVVGIVEIAGMYGDSLIVTGGRVSVSEWDKQTLRKRRELDFTKDLIIHGNRLFGHNRQGVYTARQG